jgi:PAS domain S-box-containing protein
MTAPISVRIVEPDRSRFKYLSELLTNSGHEFLIVDCHLNDSNAELQIVSLSSTSQFQEQNDLSHAKPTLVVASESILEAIDSHLTEAKIHCTIAWEALTPRSLRKAIENAILANKLSVELKRHYEKSVDFQDIVDHSPAIISRIDRNFKHTYVNLAATEATGLTQAQFLGKSNRDLGMPAELCDLWEERMRHVFEGGQELRFEFGYDSLQGRRHYQSRIVPQFSPDGSVISILGVATDITERKQFEEQLARSEEELCVTFDNAAVGIAHVALDGRWLRVNDRLCELTGYRREELLTMCFQDLSFTEELDAEWVQLNRLIAGEITSYQYEKRYVHKNGSIVWIHLTRSLLRDKDHQAHSFVSVIEDITERKHALERLRASEISRDIALQAGRMGLWDWDLATSRVSWSSTLEGIHGLAKGEFGGTIEDYFALVHPDDIPRLRQKIENAFRTGPNYFVEVRVRHKDGDYRWMAGQGQVLYDSNARPSGLTGVSWDINVAKQAEAALRESERRFKRFAHSDIVGINFADMQGGISYANDEYLRIIGYTRDHLEQGLVRWNDITPPEWRLVDERAIAEAKLRGGCTPYEKEYIRKDGTRVPILIGFSLMDDPNQVVSFVLDITSQKQTEKALKDADRRKNEFLAMLAHELRNPLAAIRNAINLLRVEPEGDASDRVWGYDVIARQTLQLSRLIDDLLDISRITSGKIRLTLEPLDLRTIIDRSIVGMHSLIAAKRQVIKLVVSPYPLRIQADAQRLEQVIGNLLTNASKYSDEASEITVSARHEANFVAIRVKDEGVGIAPEMLSEIFGLFHQADSSLDRSQGGLGIGLTLVQTLVELHGGTVVAYSDGLGRGSEFTIRFLPWTADQVLTPAPDQVERLSQAGLPPEYRRTRRILIIDDNADSARGLSRLLKCQGHSVVISTESRPGLDLALSLKPDILLLDIGLPGMDGYELARHMRLDPGLQNATIIAVSGYGQDEDRRRSKDAGFDHHFVKPVDLDGLIEIIEACPENIRPVGIEGTAVVS